MHSFSSIQDCRNQCREPRHSRFQKAFQRKYLERIALVFGPWMRGNGVRVVGNCQHWGWLESPQSKHRIESCHAPPLRLWPPAQATTRPLATIPTVQASDKPCRARALGVIHKRVRHVGCHPQAGACTHTTENLPGVWVFSLDPARNPLALSCRA